MVSQATVRAALGDIQSATVKTRKLGIEKLKDILRYHGSSSRLSSSGVEQFELIIDTVTQAVDDEQSAFAKSRTQTAHKLGQKRLESLAEVLRISVEAGVHFMRQKTAKIVVDHVMRMLVLESGDFFGPLVSEYARCLRAILTYQPHVEHLHRHIGSSHENEWKAVADFCIRCIAKATEEASGTDRQSDMPLESDGTSIRSSRSHIQNSATSQSLRPVTRQVAEEMVFCINSLTTAPSAPVVKSAAATIGILLEFLRGPFGRAHGEAFSAINNILARTRTEDITLTQNVTSHLCTLVRVYWSSRQAYLKDEMLKTLMLLRPYLFRAMNQTLGISLRPELLKLVDAIKADLSTIKDREPLNIEDIRLEAETLQVRGSICTPLFKLSCHNDQSNRRRAESAWVLVHMLASIYTAIASHESKMLSTKVTLDDDDTYSNRPHKRQRLDNPIDAVLAALQSGSHGSRCLSLQILAFVSEQHQLSSSLIAQALDHLAITCSDETGSMSHWSFIAASTLATQAAATDPTLTARWITIWQLGSRALPNASSCRGAAYALNSLLRLRIVPQTSIAELIQLVTSSMDLGGPCLFADSVVCLLSATLKASQQFSPGSSAATADSVANWLTRTYTPSRLGERAYASSAQLHEPVDALSIFAACLGRRCCASSAAGLSTWEPLGRAWISCDVQKQLTEYLLLVPGAQQHSHRTEILERLSTRPVESAAASRLSCETMIMAHLTSELTRINAELAQSAEDRSRNISADVFRMLCKSCVTAICFAFRSDFRDTRRQAQLQRDAKLLLNNICAFTSGEHFAEDRIDDLVMIFSTALPGLKVVHAGQSPGDFHSATESEKIICKELTATMIRRQSSQEQVDLNDSMDLDAEPEPQQSEPVPSSHLVGTILNDLDATYSSSAVRAKVTLYARALVSLEERPTEVAERLVDFVLDQSAHEILCTQDVFAALPGLGIVFGAADTQRLLDFFVTELMRTYAYSRSEVAIGMLLDLMTSLISVWTNREDKDLFNFGLDAYEWCTGAMLSSGTLSPNAQVRLARLLLQLCKTDADYTCDSDVPSPRTTLFTVLKQGFISTQFFLADRISTLFGHFVLSTHSAMFDDIQASLPIEAEWLEGIAIRLLFFSRLASAWHSLLRQCIYYLFETAGRIRASIHHAAQCIYDLACSLPLKSPRKLFSIFAPQLLHTWLEDNSLGTVPFEAFQYPSLNELLSSNYIELTAQLVMRDCNNGLNLVSKATKKLPKSLVECSFARTCAYAMGRDMTLHAQSDGKNVEQRLRDIMGEKEHFRVMVRREFPTILGSFYLSMQNDDDSWLEKRSDFAKAFQAITAMKTYCHSNRDLPPNQQPSFRSKHLCTQIERLCRRIGCEYEELWTPSSFTLVVRMLFDAIDESLGPLHACLMIRRIRLLIAMANETAYSGFALEVLIQTLRRFLGDNECADDILGILQFLFDRGERHLHSDLKFFTGSVILLVLQIRKQSRREHESTTLETQHRATIQNMAKFQDWLVGRLAKTLASEQPGTHSLIAALSQLQLPGNARKDSSEGALLLFLLHQWQHKSPFCSRADIREALKFLADDFEVPGSPSEDVLGEDEAALRLSQPLCEIVNSSTFGDEFTAWAYSALGRAYAASGIRFKVSRHESDMLFIPTQPAVAEEANRSITTITSRLLELLYHTNRDTAGLAEYTLRRIMTTYNDASENLTFEKVLPEPILAAIQQGNYGYVPRLVMEATLVSNATDVQALQRIISEEADDSGVEDWTTKIGIITCKLAMNVLSSPFVASLEAVLHDTPSLAAELLPCMFHILLAKEAGGKLMIHPVLSKAFASLLIKVDPKFFPRQRFCLKVLLYLRSQPIPKETTNIDRLRWLEVDLRAAAIAGARCGLPTSALLFAESVASTTNGVKGASARASLPLHQADTSALPAELLLSVFQQIDEPDSFYGVQQPATLDSVLGRLDHESSGFASLMLRTAQIDSRMRQSHKLANSDIDGLVKSLSKLSLDSLTFSLVTHGLGDSAHSFDAMLTAAKSLQQWDISPPDSQLSVASTTFAVLQELSRASDMLQIRARLQSVMVKHARSGISSSTVTNTSSWHRVLAVLSELTDLVSVTNDGELEATWHALQCRQEWMRTAHSDDVSTIVSSRHSVLSILSNNADLQRSMRISRKQTQHFEARALLEHSKMARQHMQLQAALTATATLNGMFETCRSIDLEIEAATKLETASVLWEASEFLPSIMMLRDVLQGPDPEAQSIPVGVSGLLAQTGHQLAEARLEAPEDILTKYLTPAIDHLQGRRSGGEASKVYFIFASFCDRELQNPGNIENLQRIEKLRDRKNREVQELKAGQKKARSHDERESYRRSLAKAEMWSQIDNAECERLRSSRDSYVRRSLENYLLALQSSDHHDICVLRLFALWLENANTEAAAAVVKKHLQEVPSWKFVPLMNQLMSSLEDRKSTFHSSLKDLVLRICAEHPHHSLHHLFAATRQQESSDAAALSRQRIATSIREQVARSPAATTLDKTFRANKQYDALACSGKVDNRGRNKEHVKNFPLAQHVSTRIPALRVPPATITLAVRPSGNYDDVPIVTSFSSTFDIMGGISAPKAMKAYASDGHSYKQLFKSGNDDLRQDAIMEQVFEGVSNMLRNHKATRIRDLKVRTYKVIPLSMNSGIIEFVPNSLPLNDFLRPAHKKYHPKDISDSDARAQIRAAAQDMVKKRVEVFRKVCARMQPVLRHFFFERFNDPDEWFAKRTAYTRTTASVSMLGHVLGLGDRHCHNILLDEKSGEVVHIDLGVAFEAGRVLPIPELVPFRLTRDIIDGMGITKTEGVFRRCCEFTMDALREDKDSIMTLLNVLRYDPLYNWTVSPLRAKHMQDAQETERGGGGDFSLASRADDTGEADRALSIVEKKLSKTLSTAATVNELIQQATDERNLATLFNGWAAYF